MKDVRVEIRGNKLSFYDNYTLIPNPHMHKEIEIIYAKKGSAICHADNAIYEINNGDLFVAFPNQVHYYTNSQIGEYQILIFQAEVLYNIKNVFYNNVPECNIIHIENDNFIKSMINDIFTAYGELKETIQVGMLNQLIPYCLSKMNLKDKMPTKYSNLKKILDYCSDNFTDNISLDSVAEEIHFNKYHISHLINQKLNMGFNRYINTLRINEAINLMNDKNKSIAYISEEVGFGSIRTFNRAFKQITNFTPSSYYEQFISDK